MGDLRIKLRTPLPQLPKNTVVFTEIRKLKESYTMALEQQVVNLLALHNWIMGGLSGPFFKNSKSWKNDLLRELLSCYQEDLPSIYLIIVTNGDIEQPSKDKVPF